MGEKENLTMTYKNATSKAEISKLSIKEKLFFDPYFFTNVLDLYTSFHVFKHA